MRPLTTLFALPLLLSPLVTAQTLGIEVTKAVSCNRKTENGDTISAHYRGTLQSDGTEFDSSYNRGTPFKFKLGAGQVIKGWDQGLLGMCIGEGRKLTIPPNLGYGYEASGPIPAGSTLVFETELVGIDGVEKEEEVPVAPARPTIAKPAEGASESESPPETPTPTPTSAPAKTTIIVAPSAKLIPDPAKATSGASPMAAGDDNNGECNLLGRYALIVQGALGLLAVSSLAFKRWRETPRRPLKIWFFDASKQVFGSVLLHLANILMSMLSSGSFDVAAKTKATPQYAGADEDGKSPNPCSFYLLNLAIDTTIGIPILVLLLKLLHRGFSLTPLANPPESIRSGNYGHPPHALWWLKQSFIYFLGLFGMKFCVFLLFQLLPWIAWVGDWALRWTEGNAAVQITFVMFIFPLCMNAMQYWIIDGFIKEQGGQGEGYVGVEGSEDGSEEDEEWLERRRRGRSGEELDSDVEAGEEDTLKEANPTPVPVRRGTGKDKEYDPEVDGRQGGSSRDR